MQNKNENNNSLFLYTALIFIAAIIIIIIAFLSQNHLNSSKPVISQSPVVSQSPTSGPQGIAKTAAEISEYNLELLEENRELNKELNNCEDKIDQYELLLSANNYANSSNLERTENILGLIDYESLNDDAKLLYNTIKSKLQ